MEQEIKRLSEKFELAKGHVKKSMNKKFILSILHFTLEVEPLEVARNLTFEQAYTLLGEYTKFFDESGFDAMIVTQEDN